MIRFLARRLRICRARLRRRRLPRTARRPHHGLDLGRDPLQGRAGTRGRGRRQGAVHGRRAVLRHRETHCRRRRRDDSLARTAGTAGIRPWSRKQRRPGPELSSAAGACAERWAGLSRARYPMRRSATARPAAAMACCGRTIGTATESTLTIRTATLPHTPVARDRRSPSTSAGAAATS